MSWDHQPTNDTNSCGCGACGEPLSRRQILAATAAASLMAMLGTRPASAQTALSPDDALKQLMDGNARFANGSASCFKNDLPGLKKKTVSKQEPFAAVLSCADSRVPVELVFDQSIGQIFVTRIAGNICTPEVIASLEYGAAVLGVPVIMVLGHDGCGAVKAAIANKPVPGQISALYAPLRPAIERASPDVTATIKANAKIQADILRASSPVLGDLAHSGKIKVVAAYYDLASGQATVLD